MFGSGNNHFRISISNLKERRAFSLKCFLPGNVVADLNINLLAASLSNKVDLLLIELADIDIVSTAKKLDANDVFIPLYIETLGGKNTAGKRKILVI